MAGGTRLSTAPSFPSHARREGRGSRLDRGRRVDHPADFGDLVRREAAAPSVLMDDRLVFCEVDAKGLVGGDVALDPLDVGTEFLEGDVRLLRRLAQSLPLG